MFNTKLQKHIFKTSFVSILTKLVDKIVEKCYDICKGMIEMVIRENYLNTLIDAKDTEFIKVVTGVRRSGKSTLLLMYKEYLISNNIAEDRIIHINFESAMYDYIRNYKDLYEEIKNKLSKEKTYILIDEVQIVNE